MAKLGDFPVPAAQDALRDWRLDRHQDEDGFRHAAVAFLRDHETVFELRAQLWSDAKTQPIEAASAVWPETDSPHRTVAIPTREACSPARQRYFDERMTFRPAHALAAHRPLDSLMRARLQVNRALSDVRHGGNGVAKANPTTPNEVPA